MWPKLIRFPIFWLGLLLCGLVVAQALNPAWEYQTDGKLVWSKQVPHNDKLPQGVIAPFHAWNQWRMLAIYTSGWLTVCSVWVALTRRRTLQLFVVTLAVNGLFVALLGIAQRVTGNGKIFWFYESPNPMFFSSFIYKNHGGAFLLMTLVITCGLTGWYYLRGIRRMEKSNPSGVLAFCATCIAVSILTSYARGATLVMLGFLFVVLAGFIVHQFVTPIEARRPVVVMALFMVFGLFVISGYTAVRGGKAWDKLEVGLSGKDRSLPSRQMVTKASLELLRDKWNTGIGAGSFRYVFPLYQFRYPEIVMTRDDTPTLFWEHAHNDIVQFPIELGALGSGILVLGFAYYAFALIKSYFWANPLSGCLVFGLIILLGYAWFDFPFQCPAVLHTWCVLWAVAVMWARFEESRAHS